MIYKLINKEKLNLFSKDNVCYKNIINCFKIGKLQVFSSFWDQHPVSNYLITTSHIFIPKFLFSWSF